MKKKLVVVGAAIALAITLSGCGPDKDCDPNQAGFENCTDFGCNC